MSLFLLLNTLLTFSGATALKIRQSFPRYLFLNANYYCKCRNLFILHYFALRGEESSFSNYYNLTWRKRLSLQCSKCCIELRANVFIFCVSGRMAFSLDSLPVFPLSGNRQNTCSTTATCKSGQTGLVVVLKTPLFYPMSNTNSSKSSSHSIEGNTSQLGKRGKICIYTK